MRIRFIMLLLGQFVAASAGYAAELKIGVATETTSLDPHFHNMVPNNIVARHMFETLLDQDEQQRLRPLLAESWRAVNDTTWEFKLRQEITFSDGTPFTAQDVIYTLCRVPKVVGSPSSFIIYTRSISDASAPDPHTLVIRTATPQPLLPVELSNLAILRAQGDASIRFDKRGCNGGPWPDSADFAAGKVVGTGPFLLQEYVKGERLVLARNNKYWGAKPEWERVELRPIASDVQRLAALQSGEVDLVTDLPLQDLARLKKDSRIKVVTALSNRVIYLSLDHYAEPSPTIRADGDRNPLRDPRVRRALSLAIDRQAIVQRLMAGLAIPASQLVPPGLFGYNPDISLPFLPEAAKSLLSEAGYPQGFQVTVGTPNDRYINDEKVAQEVAGMWRAIGVDTTIDPAPAALFFPRRNSFEFSVYLGGWGAATGEASSPLRALLATPARDKGMGVTNYGRYSNPEFDALLEEALRTVDEGRREALLAQAMKLAIDDTAVIPLHYEVVSWAMREGLTYPARADQYTLAQYVGRGR